MKLFTESGVLVLARTCRNAWQVWTISVTVEVLEIRDVPFGDGWSRKAKKGVREGQKKNYMILNFVVILIYTQY